MSHSKLDDCTLVSIVIVNYNGERFIKDCVKSVLGTKYPNFEVIVVDNNSKDKSIQILNEFKPYPTVKIIFLNENLHYAGGNNLGIDYAKGKYVVFLNNDTVVTPNWITELLRRFELNKNIFAIQCLLFRPGGKIIDSLGGTSDYCARPLPVTYLWTRNKEAKQEKRLFYACGAALAIRRKVLDKVGFFDPELPTDEIDLCWRINLSGGHIVLEPNAVVYHFRSGAFGTKLNKNRIFFGEIGATSAILQNYELRTIFAVLPYILSYFVMEIGNDLLVRHRVDLTLFRLKAHIHVLRNLRKIFRKRSRVQKLIRIVPDKELTELMVRPSPSYYLD